MSDEIKEILDLLKYCVDRNEYLEEPNMKNWKPLLDYITNLQEEKERLKKQLEYLRSGEYLNQIKWERDFLQSIVDENDIDYKLRNEKAIIYIKAGKTFDNENIRKTIDRIQDDLLNILTGGDKE